MNLIKFRLGCPPFCFWSFFILLMYIVFSLIFNCRSIQRCTFIFLWIIFLMIFYTYSFKLFLKELLAHPSLCFGVSKFCYGCVKIPIIEYYIFCLNTRILLFGPDQLFERWAQNSWFALFMLKCGKKLFVVLPNKLKILLIFIFLQNNFIAA